MRKINEILRLKWEAGFSHRAIAQSCSVSPGTVSDYVTRAKAAGLGWPLPEGMDEEQLQQRLFPRPARSAGRTIPQPDWPHVHTELRRKSVMLSLLWVEYRQDHLNGYGYSRFCELYRQWAKRLKPSMRLPSLVDTDPVRSVLGWVRRTFGTRWYWVESMKTKQKL